MPAKLPTAPVMVTLSLSAETPFTAVTDMLVRITNDSDIKQSFWSKTPSVDVQLPFHNGPGDDYRVIVYVKGYETAGAIVHANPKIHHSLDMLMIPSHATFDFPSWADLKAEHPAAARVIAANVTDDVAAARYLKLGKEKPLSLASLMNLSAAMDLIGLGDQKTPIDFIKQVIWDDTLAQDRFFGYADPGIIPLLQAAVAEREFAVEDDPGLLHPGATRSFKQTEFDYSNVQLTFHEGVTSTIGTLQCVMIEPDMDLYKEIVAHGLGEVLPNLSAHGLTNPLDVLALRWIDAVQSDEPLFDPGYLLS